MKVQAILAREPVRVILIVKLFVVILCCLFLAVYTSGQVVLKNDRDLDRIDVVEHLGEKIPTELSFTDDKGEQVTLAKYFKPGRPVVMVLGYYECPMLCNLVMNGLTEGVKNLPYLASEKYQVVMVGIDSGETYDLAAAKKANYLKTMGEKAIPEGWAFLVGDELQSKTLADALGFTYFYDEKQDQYAHPAVVFLLTDEAIISRYLYGIEFTTKDLKLGLLEASEGKIGTTVDRILLYCFHYDPKAGGYVLFAQNLMRIAGVVTAVGMAIALGLYWMRERRIKQRMQLANRNNHSTGING